jgi:methyltransferase (TIGR00027 family)
MVIGCYHREVPVTKIEWNRGSVEVESSGTAMWCAFARALAAAENRGNDSLAEIFLPENLKKLLKTPASRQWALDRQLPGMYAYLIARTIHFDRLIEQALRENIPQIVILGTGFDSRPYRFQDLIKDTRIFELDTPPTLKHKKELLQQANIPMHKNVIFVPINFNKDTFEEVFVKAGYDKNQKTLFLWEGVTYYLPLKAVDETLHFIKSNAPAGSRVCFDYTSSWHGLSKLDDLIAIGDYWGQNFPGEPSSQWTIEEWEINSFLSKRGYHLIDHLQARRNEIQKKYIKFRDRLSVGYVPAVFGLVTAAVAH